MGSKTRRNKKQNKNKTKPPLAKNYRGPRSVIRPHRADELQVSMGEAKENEEEKTREEKIPVASEDEVRMEAERDRQLL